VLEMTHVLTAAPTTEVLVVLWRHRIPRWTCLRVISTGMVALALSDGADAGRSEGRTGVSKGQGQSKYAEAGRGGWRGAAGQRRRLLRKTHPR
jgi:hypothetical protein